MSKVYYIDEITVDSTVDERRNWINGLNKSGYAGIKRGTGMICDRREIIDAIPIQANLMFNVTKPKNVTDGQIKKAAEKKPEIKSKNGTE